MSLQLSRGAHSCAACGRQFGDTTHCGPVRKVISRKTKKVVGRFPSDKSDSMVPWESQIERDLLFLLEADRAVVRILAQPARLRLVVDGQSRTYVPDFLVCGRGGHCWLAEVKPDDDAKLPENRLLFAAAAEACLRNSMGYRVVVQSWIRREPRLSNSKILLRYRGITPDVHLKTRAIKLLERGPVTLGELRGELGGMRAYGETMALLLDGAVSADLDQPLTDASPVWLPADGGIQ